MQHYSESTKLLPNRNVAEAGAAEAEWEGDVWVAVVEDAAVADEGGVEAEPFPLLEMVEGEQVHSEA